MYTIVDYQHLSYTCVNGEKFGNEDDNENDNGNDVIMQIITRLIMIMK